MPGDRFAWMISRYEDVDAALRDHRFTTNSADVYPPEIISTVFPTGDFSLVFLKTMIFQMPPDHTRLRTLISKSFTPRYIEQLRGRIEEISHELLDTLPEHSEVDFIEAFAYPLPITVISEMCGVLTSDHQHFKNGQICMHRQLAMWKRLHESRKKWANSMHTYKTSLQTSEGILVMTYSVN